MLPKGQQEELIGSMEVKNMPSYGEIAQIITAISAMSALIVSFWNNRKIKDIHVSINSRMDELLLSRGAEAYSEGMRKERIASDAKAALLAKKK